MQKTKPILSFLLIIYSVFLYSQQGVRGKVTDNTNRAVTDCNIFVQGTDYFTQVDGSGNYQLEIEPGEYTLEFTSSTFKEVTERVTVTKEQYTILPVKLVQESQEKVLQKVVVTGQSALNTETGLVSLQKKSVEITENVSSAQLSKQGVGDVASAVAKATGTFKQEGTGTIFIRGLGDRYNSTTLNGLPIPSDNPDMKNIDLSIFKTGIVEYISLEKVFSSPMFGDVAGANINIVSKEPKAKGYVKLGLNSGVNTQAIAQDKFWQKDGTNFWGFKNTHIPSQALSGYNFSTSWNWKNIRNPFDSGLNLEAGKSFSLGSEGKLSLSATLSFDNDYVYSKGIEKTLNAQGNALKDLTSEKYEYSTNTTGMANIIYKINQRNKISYHSLFVNSSDQTNRVMKGYIKDLAEDATGVIRRAEYKLSSLWVNQLLGSHKFKDRVEADWNVAYNILDSKNPDRQQTTTKTSELSGNPIFISNSDSDQNRYFDKLKDNEFTGGASLYYFFGSDRENKINLGYQGKSKERKFEATQINFKIPTMEMFADVNNFDSFFNQSGFESGSFIMRTFRGNIFTPGALNPSEFKGTQITHAGFVNIIYKLSDRFTVQAGARAENVNQKINWDTNLSVSTEDMKLEKTKFLPSLNLKYSLTPNHNLRMAFSKTYTMPQFIEVAPFYYEDVTEIRMGNPYLYPSDNYNFDLKWELFPKSGEVLSLTAFGKYIKNPIAKLTLSSSANEISYANVGDNAYVYGAEIEIRKDLIKFSTGKIYSFLNATVMKTQSDLNSEKIERETNGFINASFDKKKDDLQGAANFLANVNLGYNQQMGRMSMDMVISYAYVGSNIYALSYNLTGNLVEQELHLLDATLKFNLSKDTSLGFTAKNLLNPKYERKQKTIAGDITQRSYDKGRYFGLSLSQQF
ncbi:TonB-dependent receptor [Apibacter sp. HY039]|uniref:TonB-dependent receptor n=1 Tax=Apibacter sp. HY039 TaxID=2501476 RepID=UPI000FEB9A34|nr:TonB-dependent receptor [Apibacter sp. HY039]